MADVRVERQRYWKEKAIEAYEAGPDENVAVAARQVPEPWRKLPNPYPARPSGPARGQRIYQSFCIGCHGPIGDGMGPAQPFLYPPPLNFTLLQGQRHLGRDPLLPDHERHHRHGHAVLQEGAGVGEDLGRRQLRGRLLHRRNRRGKGTERNRGGVYRSQIGRRFTQIHADINIFRGKTPSFFQLDRLFGKGLICFTSNGYFLVISGLGVSFLVFFWGMKTGQFADQGRARYLPLTGKAPPSPLKNPGKLSTEVYVLLFVVGLGIAAMLAAITLTLVHI